MSKRECEWCGGEFDPPKKERRPALYCRRSCRQRAYEWRNGIKTGKWEAASDEVRYLGVDRAD